SRRTHDAMPDMRDREIQARDIRMSVDNRALAIVWAFCAAVIGAVSNISTAEDIIADVVRDAAQVACVAEAFTGAMTKLACQQHERDRRKTGVFQLLDRVQWVNNSVVRGV